MIDQTPEESKQDVPEDQSPSFEDLLMRVFSGPMCFECLDETESAETESAETESVETERDGERG